MALAQNINIQDIADTQKVNHHFLWKVSQLFTALIKRLHFHTKGYTTVFGVMLLTFISFGFLYIHWSGKKLTQVFQNRTVVEQK
ncbi:hypothetical protein H6G41_09145 [Tolypothrix sp. FACHB-123]|uniref:hypothetical protein n=1 Tax=Tolypothrix sp. FACHB-123 TaxID=2692868 RepID=UPI0016899448|nr:hypothetical protein [Tolypothrix sp. FACHB-123]MBD2354789.1 hypothetical protein [Tolypothrix sp. FACHB-123]